MIPGEASIEGTVRSYDPAVRDLAETSLRRISEDVAAAYGCTADVTYDRLCDALVKAYNGYKELHGTTGTVAGDLQLKKIGTRTAATDAAEKK